MHIQEYCRTLTLAVVVLAAHQQSGFSQDKPEVFVQTGHSTGADHLAMSEDQKYLVSAESFALMKLWDITSGREIRTIKFEGTVNNLYFIDIERFMLTHTETADVYNVRGEKIETITLPKTPPLGKMFITKSRKYLYTGDNTSDAQIYDMADGSQIKLPELNDQTLASHVVGLGFGYFGVFFSEYARSKDAKNIGSTGYVIYDEDLKVRKRGVIKGNMGYGGGTKTDRDLKALYENRNYGDNPAFVQYSLETGEVLCSIPMKGHRREHLLNLPDGRFVLGYMAKNELVDFQQILNEDLTILEILDNGMFKEKHILLERLTNTGSFCFGKNGVLIVAHNGGSIKRYDGLTGKEAASFGAKPVVLNGNAYADGKLLNIWQNYTFSTRQANVIYNLWNLRDASLEKFSVSVTTTDGYQKNGPYGMMWYLTNPDALFAKVPKEFFVDDFNDPKWKEYYERAPGVCTVFLKEPPSTLNLSFSMKDNYIAVVEKSAKVEVARMYAFADGEWIIITPEGYFNASRNGAKCLNVRVGTNVYSIDNFYERFFNPSYVASVLTGQKGVQAADMRKGIALPPEVKITSPAPGAQFASDILTVTISAKDMGGGIDEIRLYQNGKMISDDQRGMKSAATTKSYQVSLLSGINTFRAVAFNRERTESNPDEIKVELKAAQAASDLYVFVVGINEYKNGKYNLNYGKPDATAFLNAIVGKSRTIFKQAHPYQLYDAEATRPTIESTFRTIAVAAKPQDTFVFYYAGHGVMSEGNAAKPADFFLIPTDVTSLYGDDAMLGAKAVSAAQLKTFCTTIKAQKQLVILDACQSGGAVASFATRGLSEERAILQLARSAGTVLLASTGTEQFATEFATLAHGVFTYALLQGLGGNAGNPSDGKITVKQLEAYLNDQVPELTKKYRGTAQYPNSYSRGQDFPLGVK